MCVPTYREPHKAKLFLDSLVNVVYPSLEIIVINANGPDETSIIIDHYSKNVKYKLTEIYGTFQDYWSASINRGLSYIEKNVLENGWIILINIDVEFSCDIVSSLVNRATLLGNCQIGAVALSNSTVISSGVSVISWALTLNKHPYAGWDKQDIPNNFLCPVDYLPGRCFIFPAMHLKKAGLIDDKNLPHYCADYEFSYRLNKLGCPAYIDTEVLVHADMNNTGFSIYDNNTTIINRFSQLFSIKNPSNPYYRLIMVKKMFPYYFIPFGMFFYFLRSIVEVLFGNKFILRILNDKENGFSGAKKI